MMREMKHTTITFSGVTLPLALIDGKAPIDDGRLTLLRWRNGKVHWQQPTRSVLDDGTDWLLVAQPNVYAEPLVMQQIAKVGLRQASGYRYDRDPSYHWREKARAKG